MEPVQGVNQFENTASTGNVDEKSKQNKTVDSLISSGTEKVFKNYSEQKNQDFKNSKEYATLLNKFTKIAARDFDKIYSSTFEGKNDKVREAFIEKHAEQLCEIFLNNLEIKSHTDVVHELHDSWSELLDQMFPHNFKFDTVDANHPFGTSGSKNVYIKSRNITVEFMEKDGHLSAKVGEHIFETRSKGVKGILKLYSKIVLTKASQNKLKLDVDNKLLSKSHKLALKLLYENKGQGSGLAWQTSGSLMTGLERLADKGEGFRLIAEEKDAISEQAQTTGHSISGTKNATISSEGATHHLSEAGKAAGGLGIAFGAITIVEGLHALAEAIHAGIKDEEFLKLYSQFEAECKKNNPPLNDVEIFQIKELDQVVETMRKRSKVIALSGEGVLKVISGSANIISGAGILVHVSTIAASGSGFAGGILIVSGSIEMTKACRKLQKLGKTGKNIEKAETGSLHDLQQKEYEAGLVKSFLEIQADMIDNKKTKEHLNFTNGGGLVLGGTLLVASAIAGLAAAPTFGIGAAVVLGAGAVGVVAGKSYLAYEDHKIEALQTKLLAQDIAQVRKEQSGQAKNPYRNMRSTAGKLMEVYQAVKEEQANKTKDAVTPISTHIMQQYVGMHPDEFLKIMKNMDEEFMASLKDPNVASTGMFIKNEELDALVTKSAGHLAAAAKIKGADAEAKFAGLFGAEKSKQKILKTAEKEKAKLEVKQELRTLKVLFKAQKRAISKENEVLKKQEIQLHQLANVLTAASTALKESQHLVSLLPPEKAGDDLGARIKDDLNQAINATKAILSEASKLTLKNASAAAQNVNVEYVARDAIKVLDKEISDLQGRLNFALLNEKIDPKDRIEHYNHLQNQHQLVETIGKQARAAVNLLDGLVDGLREVNRAEFAIKDSRKRLKALGYLISTRSKKSIEELTEKKLNEKNQPKIH